MTPVKQTITGTEFANCLQACIATYFDFPLNRVPNFMLFGKEYWESLYLFIRSIGFSHVAYVDGLPPADDKYYIVSVDFGDEYKYSHAVILKNNEIVHDPHPSGINKDDNIVGYYEIK